MPRVGYNSAYIPPEWIAAHGLQPWRPTLDVSCSLTQPVVSSDGCCSWARSFVEQVSDGQDVAAVIVAAVCDQVRRAGEGLLAEVPKQGPAAMLFHIPATWQTAAAQQCYRDELHRLGQLIERLGGTAPSPEHLRDVMTDYERQRRALRDNPNDLNGREFAQAISDLHGDPCQSRNEQAAAENDPAKPPLASKTCSYSQGSCGTRLALFGSEVPRYHWWLYDVIEQYGGRVALDATDYGERGLPEPFDPRLMAEDPFEAMASAYLQIPHVRQRPNESLFRWLAENMERRQVQGLILRRSLWCDLWHAEVARIKDWAPVPVLDLDLDVDTTIPERAKGRIAAFLEMLQ
jgi:benzoyl-CoA reductase/2-hydroxyglutaryl-CoA dehydratase subunit BcrC/BadD/HgdB